jgi:hypothetical protein
MGATFKEIADLGLTYQQITDLKMTWGDWQGITFDQLVKFKAEINGIKDDENKQAFVSLWDKISKKIIPSKAQLDKALKLAKKIAWDLGVAIIGGLLLKAFGA